MYNPNESFKANCDSFNVIASKIKEINITYAVKDTNFEGTDVKEGDFMSMANKSIIACGSDLIDVVNKSIDEIVTDDDELVTIITGMDSNENDLKKICDYIEKTKDCEVQIINGNVPVYYYLIGAE